MPKYDELYKQVADALRHTYPQTHAEELLQVFNEAIDLAESSDTFPNTAEIVEDECRENSWVCSKCGTAIPTADDQYSTIKPSDVLYCYHCGAKLHHSKPQTITVDQFAQFLLDAYSGYPSHYLSITDTFCDGCEGKNRECRRSCWIKYAKWYVSRHTEKGSEDD